MKARALLIFSGLLAISATARSETVSIEVYLDEVRARHPFFVKESMQPDIEQLGQDRLVGTQDWTLTSHPFVRYEEPVASSTFQAEHATTAGLNAGLERAFWGHGGRLGVGWRWDFVDQKLPQISIPGPNGLQSIPLGPSTFYTNRLLATYSLPLMQNRGGVLDRLDYDLSGFEVDFAKIVSLENQENFLLDVAGRYVGWAFQFERARIAKALLALQEEQLDRTRRKRRANLVDEVDVLRGEDAVQSARQTVVNAESRLKAQKVELAVLARNGSINDMEPDMDLYRIVPLPTADEAVEGIGSQRVVRSLRTRAEQLRTQRKGFESLADPQLFLNLTGGLQDGGDGVDNSWGLTEPVVEVALDFRFPLKNRAAKADVARVTLQTRQLEKDIESVSLDIEARLRSVIIGIEELVQIMAVNREQIETARKKTIEEQRLYDQGRNELNFVIQSRNAEALSELRYAESAAAYQKLVLAYRALVDQLLPLAAAD